MQTFLPFPSFTASAKVLDYRRLGKQRVETLQILNALSDPSYGWQNHPAVKMWRGHAGWLVDYGLIICDAWLNRGYKDTCRDKIAKFEKLFTSANAKPSWLGNEAFHLSHQSNLIRKDPSHYGPLFPGVPSDLPYIWPA